MTLPASFKGSLLEGAGERSEPGGVYGDDASSVVDSEGRRPAGQVTSTLLPNSFQSEPRPSKFFLLFFLKFRRNPLTFSYFCLEYKLTYWLCSPKNSLTQQKLQLLNRFGDSASFSSDRKGDGVLICKQHSVFGSFGSRRVSGVVGCCRPLLRDAFDVLPFLFLALPEIL